MVQTIKFREDNGREAECLGRDEKQDGALQNKFQFLDLQRKLGFPLGFFSSGDLFAHWARMLAVESFRDGGRDRFRLEILCEHVCPRHRLQYGPMPTRRAEQRENQEEMAQTN